MKIRKSMIAAFAATTVLMAASPASADYPEKSIKLIVPFAAGGGSDALARTIQAAIEKNELMDQKLVIVNADGAGGTIGARQAKDAKADGYTFLQIHTTMLAAMASEKIEFGLDAFTPVSQTTQSCLYVAAGQKSGISNFDDLVAKAKEAPGSIKVADSIGSVSHFLWAQIMETADIDVGMVQVGGSAKRFASLKGGLTSLALMSPSWVKRGGDDLTSLLWLGADRPTDIGDMPSASDIGIDVAGCLNRVFYAPAGAPQEAIDYFGDVLAKVMQTEELQAYHEKSGSTVVIKTGEELSDALQAELEALEVVAPAVKAAMGN
ncbi:tripartite tricarboxylate transporter substrate binding protein [Sulfitobacter sp. AS92]|uniref:Bug family tripartite tricarboxylate transporter substrate binding protein n=1 Tax=Sulfitobacter sp. AS92 TaxID=3135783 RepID=UPI00317FE944